MAEQEKAAVQADFDAAQQARAALHGELDAARQAHAAAQARQEEGRRQIETLELQLHELRTQFSTELERTREQVAVAQKRASATSCRARVTRSTRYARSVKQAVADLHTERATA